MRRAEALAVVSVMALGAAGNAVAQGLGGTGGRLDLVGTLQLVAVLVLAGLALLLLVRGGQFVGQLVGVGKNGGAPAGAGGAAGQASSQARGENTQGNINLSIGVGAGADGKRPEEDRPGPPAYGAAVCPPEVQQAFGHLVGRQDQISDAIERIASNEARQTAVLELMQQNSDRREDRWLALVAEVRETEGRLLDWLALGAPLGDGSPVRAALAEEIRRLIREEAERIRSSG